MNTPSKSIGPAFLVACACASGAFAQPNGSWARVPFTVGPSARGEHSVAYDSARNRVVLFGGSQNRNAIHLGDTWEWDGTQWTLVATTGPSPRRKPAMWFDPTIGKTVLFGGSNGNFPWCGKFMVLKGSNAVLGRSGVGVIRVCFHCAAICASASPAALPT